MRRLLLSVLPAEWLASVGLWMIIGGLVADGLLAVDAIFWEAIPPKPGKWLSLAFTLTIALGVWLEHIGMDEIAAIRRRPRRALLAGQLPSITAALQPFANITFDAGVGPNDKDVEDFLWDLEPGLWAAGWTQVDWIWPDGRRSGIRRAPGRRTIATDQACSNVSVQIHPGQEAALGPAADALVTALNAAGFDAQRDGFNIHNGNVNAMHVLIGPRR